MVSEISEIQPYEEKVGNEALSMYISVNLRVLCTIPTQLFSPLGVQMRNKSKQRSFIKYQALLIEGYYQNN